MTENAHQVMKQQLLDDIEQEICRHQCFLLIPEARPRCSLGLSNYCPEEPRCHLIEELMCSLKFRILLKSVSFICIYPRPFRFSTICPALSAGFIERSK